MKEYHVTGDVYFYAKDRAKAEAIIRGARNYMRRKLDLDFEWDKLEEREAR